jgi:recombinational DNA repair protein RecT
MAESKYLTLLESRKSDFLSILPPYVSRERFLDLARAAQRDLARQHNGAEWVRKASTDDHFAQQLFGCVMDAARNGIEIGGPNAHSAIVMFQSTPVLIVQWQGRVYQWIRSGAIVKAEAHVVYNSDQFAVVYGDEQRIEHTPNYDEERSPKFLNDMENIRAAYAIAWLPNGEKVRAMLSRWELKRIREWVARKNKGVLGFGWQDWVPEMCMKSAVHRLKGWIVPPANPSPEQAEAWSRYEKAVESDSYTVSDEPPLDDDLAPPPRTVTPEPSAPAAKPQPRPNPAKSNIPGMAKQPAATTAASPDVSPTASGAPVMQTITDDEAQMLYGLARQRGFRRAADFLNYVVEKYQVEPEELTVEQCAALTQELENRR